MSTRCPIVKPTTTIIYNCELEFGFLGIQVNNLAARIDGAKAFTMAMSRDLFADERHAKFQCAIKALVRTGAPPPALPDESEEQRWTRGAIQKLAERGESAERDCEYWSALASDAYPAASFPMARDYFLPQLVDLYRDRAVHWGVLTMVERDRVGDYAGCLNVASEVVERVSAIERRLTEIQKEFHAT